MDRRRRTPDEVPGTVNAFATSLLLGSDVDADSIEASFVAEGLEQKKAEQLVDSQIDKPLNLHGITSKICVELGVPLGVRSDSPAGIGLCVSALSAAKRLGGSICAGG